jgi:hypothetical protein
MIATADGGVIATDDSGAAVTFDQNGSATGQLASLPTYSWKGNAYQVGSIEQWVRTWFPAVHGYSPFAGANQSGNLTSVLLDWFPPLDTCRTPGCIGHDEAINNAFRDLLTTLPAVRGLVKTKVFDKLGYDANAADRFIKYLTAKHPGFFDGTQSTYCKDALKSPSLYSTLCVLWGSGVFLTSVEDLFEVSPTVTAYTETPSDPLLIFFRPSSILKDNSGKNPVNEATIFHEALHGFTGLFDLGLANALGVSLPSCNISEYIETYVLSHSPATSCQ